MSDASQALVRGHSVSPKPTTDFPLYIHPYHHTQPPSPSRGYPGSPWACLHLPMVACSCLWSPSTSLGLSWLCLQSPVVACSCLWLSGPACGCQLSPMVMYYYLFYSHTTFNYLFLLSLNCYLYPQPRLVVILIFSFLDPRLWWQQLWWWQYI